MAAYTTEHEIFIKSISPLADEAALKDVFKSVTDPIKKIEFLNYPGSSERYVRIAFESHSGVALASNLNGTTLMGVPMQISVLNPTSTNRAQAPGPTSQSVLDPLSLGSVRPTILSISGSEEAALARTVYIGELPDWFELEDLKLLLEGRDVRDMKLRLMPNSSRQFALVEFGSQAVAQTVKRMRYLHFKNFQFEAVEAKCTVSVVKPSNVIFGKPVTIGRHVMAINPKLGANQRSRELLLNKVARVVRGIERELQGLPEEEEKRPEKKRELDYRRPESRREKSVEKKPEPVAEEPRRIRNPSVEKRKRALISDDEDSD